MLKVDNISTGYGKKQVIFDISFEVKKGEIVLLTGGNGSGKSTILKVIYGLIPLWKGSIMYNNENLVDTATCDMPKKGIIYISQKNNYFENLTINENLKIAGSIYTKSELNNRLEKVWNLPKLYQYRNRTPFNLSGGERRLLAFGMALIHNPSILLFDEPFAGIDNSSKSLLSNKLEDMNNNKSTILIVEHSNSFSIKFDKNINIQLGHLSKTIMS